MISLIQRIVASDILLLNIAGPGALVVVGLVINMFTMHLMVTASHGFGKVVPPEFFKHLMIFIWNTTKVFLVAVLISIVFLIPYLIIVAAFPELKTDPFVLRVLFVNLSIGFLLLVLVYLRLGILLPGVAVNEASSLRAAWKLSSGHTFRMLGSIIVGLLLLAVLNHAVLLLCRLLTGVLEALVTTILGSFFYGLGCFFSSTIFCVWYVRLKERHDGLDVRENVANVGRKFEEESSGRQSSTEKEASSDADYGQCQD